MDRIFRVLLMFFCFMSLGAANYDANSVQNLKGTIDILVYDNFKAGVSNTEYYLNIPQADNQTKSVLLHFSDIPNLHTGSEVELNVSNQKDGSFVVNTWKEIQTEKKTNNTTSVRKVLYVIVNLADAQVVETLAQLIPVIQSASTWLNSATYNNLNFPPDSNGDGQVDLVGPITIPDTTAAGCQARAWATSAITVLQSMGIDTNAYQHLFFITPPGSKTSCTWAGLGLLGCGDKCMAWTNNNTWILDYVHELGHNFGFYHASSDPDNDLVINDAYGDGSCPMGNTIASGYYNAPHQKQLGWLSEAAGDLTRITGNGSYSLIPMSTLPLGGTRVLLTDRDAANDYYISYRPTTAFDKPANPGVVINTMNKTVHGNSLWVTTLVQGQKLTTTNLQVKVNGVDKNGNMKVDVLTSCFEDPVMTVTPQYSAVNTTHPVTYKLVVKNTQAATCPSVNVSLSSNLASNLSLQIPTPTFVLRPGEESDQDLQLKTTTNTGGWTVFNLNLTATNGTPTYGANTRVVSKVFIGRTLPSIVNGVNLSHYSGSWNILPDFTFLTPDITKATTQVRMTDYSGKTAYGLRFEGFIQINTAGEHTFYLNSDDGSSLTINGVKVINNDGIHGAIEVSGKITLDPGLYPIMVDYFQGGGGAGLTLSHTAPNSTDKLEVPATDLFRYGDVAPPAQPPVANAGPDMTANAFSTVTINGSGSSPDDVITGYSWTKVSGPNVVLVNPKTPSLTLNNVPAGAYVFRLTVSNSFGDTASDDMSLNVTVADVPPVVSAGADISVQQGRAAKLTGTASDPINHIVDLRWTLMPSGSALRGTVDQQSLVYNFKPTVVGVYQYKFTATNDKGLSASDIVQVTVTP